MIDDVRRLLDQYTEWLRDKTQLRGISDEWVEITTPHVDRHNDMLQIYVKQVDGGFLLSDGGCIIEDLESSGFKLDTPKRQELLKLTLAGFGILNNSGALEVHATASNFPLRKHSLIQAMLAVNDLFNLSAPTVSSLFYEDVVTWLDLVDVRYTPRLSFVGKSGYTHQFDFVIPKSKKQPERVLQAVARPNRDAAESIAFRWIDTRDVRSADSKIIALLNDQGPRVSQDVIDAMKSYDTNPILWSQRESIREELAA